MIFELRRNGTNLTGTHFLPFATGCAAAQFPASGRVEGRDRIVINTKGVTNYEITSCRVNTAVDVSAILQRIEPKVDEERNP